MKYVPLSLGMQAMVDDDDYDWVMQKKWHAKPSNNRTHYASHSYNEKGVVKTMTMHRFIMDPPSHKQIDHIDGNGLNNTRANLRICTKNQNMQNKIACGRTSKFKGVHFYKKEGTWEAFVGHCGEKIYLGRYPTESEAAKAYNAAASYLHKEFARPNRIEALE